MPAVETPGMQAHDVSPGERPQSSPPIPSSWVAGLTTMLRAAPRRVVPGVQRILAHVVGWASPILVRADARGPAGAAFAQQVRSLGAPSPRAVRTFVLPALAGVVLSHLALGAAPLPMATAMMVAIAVVTTSFGVLGLDTSDVACLEAPGAPLRQVLRGKALAPLVLLLPLVAAFVLVEATIGAVWGDVPSALLTGVGVALLGVGIGAVASVRYPYDRDGRAPRPPGVLLGLLRWVLVFFAAVFLGGVIWMISSGSGAEVGVGAVSVVAGAALTGVLIDRAGRALEEDPWSVRDALVGQEQPASEAIPARSSM